MTKREIDEYNRLLDKWVVRKATSKEMLRALALRRKWEHEKRERKDGAA
jgi:hypothetical protein